MSWFTKYVEHPFVAALSSLQANPAITGNPEAAAAVQSAKDTATTIATATNSAAAIIVSDAQAASDPAICALGTGLEAAVDAYLLAAIGVNPLEGLAASAAHTLIALGEGKAHDLVTALFAHAKTQVPTAKAA